MITMAWTGMKSCAGIEYCGLIDVAAEWVGG